MAAKSAGDQSTDNVTLPGSGSTGATDLLTKRLPDQANGSNPLVMVLIGKAAWWMPRLLDRSLPRISIEGEDYFAQRDAKVAGRQPPQPQPASGS